MSNEPIVNHLMPKRFQAVSSSNTFEHLERLNRIESFLIEKCGYDPDDTTIHEKQRNQNHDRLVKEENANDANERKLAQKRDEKFNEFLKNQVFVTAPDGTVLKFSDRLEDVEQHQFSTTIIELVNEQLGGWKNDSNILDNPTKFLQDFARLDGHTLDYTFHRPKEEVWQHDSEWEYFTVQYVIKMRYPPK